MNNIRPLAVLIGLGLAAFWLFKMKVASIKAHKREEFWYPLNFRLIK